MAIKTLYRLAQASKKIQSAALKQIGFASNIIFFVLVKLRLESFKILFK